MKFTETYFPQFHGTQGINPDCYVVLDNTEVRAKDKLELDEWE